MTDNLIIVLCVSISVFLAANCFLIGYIVGSKNKIVEETNKYSLKELIKSNKRNNKSEASQNAAINIDESKVVSSIKTDNLEKKYTQLGDVKNSEENISNSVNKLKKLKS
jgi:hypothetical protein